MQRLHRAQSVHREPVVASGRGKERVRVVITLRADFYHHCAEYEGLRQALQTHQAYIGAMTPDELRQAITAPAEKPLAGTFNLGWWI